MANLLELSAVELVKSGFTGPQLFALRFAQHEGDGYVYAGTNVTRRGAGYLVNASTLRALARRGFVELGLHADGGMAAKLTSSGRDVAFVLEKI